MTFNKLDKFIRDMRYSKVLPLIQNNKVVLDFGCGEESAFLNHISNMIKKGIGVDNKYNLENKDNIIFIRNIDDAQEKVDIVVSLAVLEHLDNPDIIVKKLYDTLKNDGIIIITTPSKFSMPILEIMAFFNLINKEEIRDHKHYYNKNELEIMFMNFKNVKISYFQFGLNIILSGRK